MAICPKCFSRDVHAWASVCPHCTRDIESGAGFEIDLNTVFGKIIAFLIYSAHILLYFGFAAALIYCILFK